MSSIRAGSIDPAAPIVQARKTVPGNRAIWVGIFAELTEFALMFMVYFFARVNHPQAFHAGPQKLSLAAGTVNTLIMITSSFLVARAIHAIREERRRSCLRWLIAALLVALGYPVVKFLEIRWNVSQGLTGDGDVFQMSYYYLTFNHLVHVSWASWGCCGSLREPGSAATVLPCTMAWLPSPAIGTPRISSG